MIFFIYMVSGMFNKTGTIDKKVQVQVNAALHKKQNTSNAEIVFFFKFFFVVDSSQNKLPL